MKLTKVLDGLNSLEKNSFIKIIDNIITEGPVNKKEIDLILTQSEGQLKNVDNENISKVFNLVNSSFAAYLNHEFANLNSQLEVAIDIIIRDGNCIMSREWFSQLYEQEIKTLNKKVIDFKKILDSEEMDPRIRDYKIYLACVHTAFYNDKEYNRDPVITLDEKSILNTLSKRLGLSLEEVRLIKAQIIPFEKTDIDSIIKDLKELGILFYSKKNLEVYIPDEVVKIIRKLKGKELADKHFRRILKHLRDPHINLIARRHNIDRSLSIYDKTKAILKEGIKLSDVLTDGIFKENISINDRKGTINDLMNKLNIETTRRGFTIEDKIKIIINHFEEIENDTKVSISIDGYDKLLVDVNTEFPELNDMLKSSFELQSNNVLNSLMLLNYNIKPRDILDLFTDEQLKKICQKYNIKSRGDQVENILENYKDTENIFIENFANIGKRNLAGLKEDGIIIKESEIGLKYEELTKLIFKKLGFNVDESLRKKLNNAKNKIDILLNLGNKEVILIECKTSKDRDYNKFSTVSRQLKAYQELVRGKEFNVVKTLLVADNFSEDFISECEVDFELNLSLIKSISLLEIYRVFKKSAIKKFPTNLIKRDVVINEERIIRALLK